MLRYIAFIPGIYQRILRSRVKIADSLEFTLNKPPNLEYTHWVPAYCSTTFSSQNHYLLNDKRASTFVPELAKTQ